MLHCVLQILFPSTVRCFDNFPFELLTNLRTRTALCAKVFVCMCYRYSNPAYPFSYIQSNQTSTFQTGSANNYTSPSQQVRFYASLWQIRQSNLTVLGWLCYVHVGVLKWVDFCRHWILILCFRMVLPRITFARMAMCGIDQLRKQLHVDARVATG